MKKTSPVLTLATWLHIIPDAQTIVLVRIEEPQMTKTKAGSADRLDKKLLESVRGGFGAGHSSDGNPAPPPTP
jgi:hypothetical protein